MADRFRLTQTIKYMNITQLLINSVVPVVVFPLAVVGARSAFPLH